LGFDAAGVGSFTVTHVVFWIVFASGVVTIAGVLLSWGRPVARIWPPPRGGSWQAVASWVSIEVTMAGPLVLGILDWNAWILPSWMRAIAGLVLVPVGFGIGLAAMRQLTLAASFGLQGRLSTEGLYRFSRNPQCVGFIAGYLGFALLCNSLLTLVTAVLLSVELGLSPFAEEPWLCERFGQAYRDYARRVPRFLGRPAPS
jgi:protein-S-isoprenylcysteine O-methyltransferase Ste14